MPLPSTFKAAVLHEYGQGLVVESIPMPQLHHGHVIVRVETTIVYGPWKGTILQKHPMMKYPTPFSIGGLCVGRIVAAGADATLLTEGQLVLTDYFLRARDDPDGVQFLRGGMAPTPGAEKLASTLYRYGSFGEYMLVPFENCHLLDEKLLLGSPTEGGLGFTKDQLLVLGFAAIPYTGLKDLELQAGEVVAILPATGVFGGQTVETASAMGARVIAAGRNKTALQKLKDNIPNVKTVELTGDVDADAAALKACYGSVDAMLDVSPPTVPNLNHTSAGFKALSTYGRASLMGAQFPNLPVSYLDVVFKSLSIKGRFMYKSSNTIKEYIKLVYAGALKPSRINVVGQYKLEEWSEALDKAEETHGWGNLVVLHP